MASVEWKITKRMPGSGMRLYRNTTHEAGIIQQLRDLQESEKKNEHLMLGNVPAAGEVE